MAQPTLDEDVQALKEGLALLARAVRSHGGPDIADDLAALAREQWDRAEALQRSDADEQIIGHFIRLAQALTDLHERLTTPTA